MSLKFIGAIMACLLFPSEQATQAPQVRVDYTLSYGANRYKWKVFIGEDPAVLDRIRCVEYTLDPVFPDPVRKTCNRADKFAVYVTGADAFKILLKIDWKNGNLTRQSYMLSLHESEGGPSTVTLNNSFIEKYKDRVTIDATFTVDRVGKIQPPSLDGDIHIAGRAPEIGLPTVAEIMNAKLESNSAIKKIQAIQGTGRPIGLSGAWRIWWERLGEDVEVQGASDQPLTSSGAAHLFEIHPVSKVDGRSLAHTFIPIAGYQTKDADTAFSVYERTYCRIIPHQATTTIVSNKAGYNYVEFVLRLTESPHTVPDGTMVFADVGNLQGDTIVKHRRMVFVKDTQPETKVRPLRAGDRLHVVGVPRMDLSQVSSRVKVATASTLKDKYPGILESSLPYEIIVVAVVE